MFGEERFVFSVDSDVVVNDDAFPLMVTAKPNSKGFILKSPFFILEQSGDKPLCFITKNLHSFQKISEFG